MESASLPVAIDPHPEARSCAAEDRSLVNMYTRYFDVIPADTPDRLDACYRLRYEMYCLEHAFENLAEHPDGREIDQYDVHSAHSLLIHRPTGAVAGTVRLILPRHDNPLPIARVCNRRLFEERIATAPGHLEVLRSAGEISRFTVSKQFRRRATDTPVVDYGSAEERFAPTLTERRVMLHITLGLMKAVFQMSVPHGIPHLFAVLAPALLRLITRLGIHRDPIGPLGDYHGRRQPCHKGLCDILARMRLERPDAWELVTSG